MNFWCWFWTNLYSNLFTLITVLLSGIISWIISAAYYRMGNRTNLKMSVIYPTTELIAKTRSYDNYTNLCKLAKDYTVRYMSKRERKVLIDLLDAYKEVARYNEDSVNSDIVLSYFEETVNSHSVDFSPVPVTINGEIVDYEPPEGYFAIQDNLYRIISAKNPNYQSNECQKAITQYFEGFCKQYYPNTNISFFTDRTLDDVLRDGEIRKAWRKKFATFKQAKENFLVLRIVKTSTQ